MTTSKSGEESPPVSCLASSTYATLMQGWAFSLLKAVSMPCAMPVLERSPELSLWV